MVLAVSSFIKLSDAAVESIDVCGCDMLVLLFPIVLWTPPDEVDTLLLLLPVVPMAVRLRLLVRPLDLLRRLELAA